MSSNKEYWFVGECMAELRRAGPGLLAQSFAGDVYNTAVYFQRMAENKAACFVTAVGIDSLSEALLEEAATQGLDTRRVARVPERQPGLYWIELNAQGERSFLYWRAQSAARAMLDEEHALPLHARTDACSLLYFSGITLAILDEKRRQRLLALAHRVKEAGGQVAFDSNYRPGLWESAQQAIQWCDAASAMCTHALVTFEDEQQLHGDARPSETLKRLLACGAAEAVVKLGAQGCLVQTGGMATPLAVPALRAEAIDTTAAGDSFNAAFLASRIGGRPVAEAAQEACRLAALVVAYPGAIIAQADWVRLRTALM